MSTVLSDLDELIPLALVIAISPLSIIPGILVLHTSRPRPTSLAFLIGWVLGIAVITGAFVGGSDVSNDGLDTKPTWAPYVRVGLGLAATFYHAYIQSSGNAAAIRARLTMNQHGFWHLAHQRNQRARFGLA